MDSAVVLPIGIAASAATATVDTGASVSVLDEGLAARLGLDVSKTITIQSDVGATTARQATHLVLRLGRNELALGPLIVTDLSGP